MAFRFEEAAIIEKAHEERELQLIYNLAEKSLGEPIKLDDFGDIRSKEEIEHDKKLEEHLPALFAKETTAEVEERKRWATIFEAIVHNHVELDDWLGSDARTVRPSRYDDYMNGVDTIIEFGDEKTAEADGSHLALAVDVAYGASLTSKLDRIKREIENGSLTTVKYFKSEDGMHKGSLSHVPRVVIGAELGTVKELAESWAQMARGEREHRKEHKRDLAEHPIQLQMLDEIRVQLSTFRNYAEHIGQHEAARVYYNALHVINRAAAEKEPLFKRKASELETLRRNDATFAVLQGALESRFERVRMMKKAG